MNERDFCHELKIEVTELELWMQQDWLSPRTVDERRHFRNADLARARLILDLTNNLGINEAGVDIILGLVDQLHGLRGAMRDITLAVKGEDVAVQQCLHAALDKLHQSR